MEKRGRRKVIYFNCHEANEGKGIAEKIGWRVASTRLDDLKQDRTPLLFSNSKTTA